MRCRDAKQWLAAQRDDNQVQAEYPVLVAEPLLSSTVEEHLVECLECRTYQQRLRRLDTLFCPSTVPTRPVRASISTDNIMRAIQQQKRITDQLENIQQQQQSRVARWRPFGTALAAITFFTVGSIPLLLFAIIIIRTDLAVKVLSLLNGIIDVVIILAQYSQAGVTMAMRNNWLLSGAAFAIVIMMGMWLRLMRHPREA
jgi:predicted anti-sigma-YlaC factor YlaD